MHPKGTDGMANSVDPPGSALFAQTCLSKYLGSLWYLTFEPPRDKTSKMISGPSKDSDQPGHPPSLIRVFPVCSMGS